MTSVLFTIRGDIAALPTLIHYYVHYVFTVAFNYFLRSMIKVKLANIVGMSKLIVLMFRWTVPLSTMSESKRKQQLLNDRISWWLFENEGFTHADATAVSRGLLFVLDKAMKSRSVPEQAKERTASFHSADGTLMRLPEWVLNASRTTHFF